MKYWTVGRVSTGSLSFFTRPTSADIYAQPRSWPPTISPSLSLGSGYFTTFRLGGFFPAFSFAGPGAKQGYPPRSRFRSERIRFPTLWAYVKVVVGYFCYSFVLRPRRTFRLVSWEIRVLFGSLGVPHPQVSPLFPVTTTHSQSPRTVCGFGGP